MCAVSRMNIKLVVPSAGINRWTLKIPWVSFMKSKRAITGTINKLLIPAPKLLCRVSGMVSLFVKDLGQKLPLANPPQKVGIIVAVKDEEEEVFLVLLFCCPLKLSTEAFLFQSLLLYSLPTSILSCLSWQTEDMHSLYSATLVSCIVVCSELFSHRGHATRLLWIGLPN